MWQKKMRVPGAIVLLCVLAACNDDGTPTGPTTPPAPPTEAVFEGNITRNGAASHDFTPAAGGVVTATLRSLGGPEGLVVGFALGNWFAGACSLVFANDNATEGAVLTGTLSQSGPLCVRIADGGNIEPGLSVPYAIEVVHP